MTQKQIEGLKADVFGDIMGRIEDLFIDYQQAMKVKSGDIDPLSALNLEQKEKELAEIITNVLVAQKGE